MLPLEYLGIGLWLKLGSGLGSGLEMLRVRNALYENARVQNVWKP